MHWTDSRNLISEMKLPDYDPDFFIDAILHRAGFSSDRALARELGLAPPVISKIRHRALCIGPTVVVRIHELTGLRVKELRELMFGRDKDGGRLDKFSFRRRITRHVRRPGEERLKLHAGDCEVHIWTNDRGTIINSQARCGRHHVTLGIAHAFAKSKLLLPAKREIDACSPGMGHRLLMLANTGLSLFGDLSDTDGGLIRQDRLQERLEMIRDEKDLQAALVRITGQLNSSDTFTICYI